jgi:nucleoside-diphosphate-sugar epimerase
VKAVVLGGGGFIGANLVRRLVADGHNVLAVDIAFPEDRRPALRGAALRELHLTDWWSAKLAGQGSDWVFHLAADMGGVGYFHSDADLGAAMTNGQITLNVLATLKPHQRLFYAASACAYPIELQGRPLVESMLGHGTPDALYGAEKLHGLRLCSKVPNARVGVFDTIYGPLQEHDGRRMKFPAAVLTKALAARETGTLELWGDGGQRRSYLFIDDAVDRIVRVMEADHYDGPVNIAARGTVSCMEVARMALEIVGAGDAEITTNPAEPSGVQSRECDTSKFDDTYGRTDEVPLREGMTKFAESIEPKRAKTATRTPPDRAVMPPVEKR